MSERQFRTASVLVVVGVLAVGLAGALPWAVPVDAGDLVCGRAVDSLSLAAALVQVLLAHDLVPRRAAA